MKKVLVTGGSGFLGTHLVNRLLEQGREVRVIDIKDCSNKQVDFIKADIRVKENVMKASKDVETIFHLASLVPQSKVPYSSYYDTIVNGTQNILESGRQHNIKVVHISSSGVYGGKREGALNEEAEKNPSSDYGKAKWYSELKCMEYKDEVDVVILRPMAIIGPGVYGIFKKFLKLVNNGFPLITFGKGDNKIQMVSASDTVEAILLAEKYKKSGEAFNLGSENIPTVNEQFKALIEYANSKSLIIPIPASLAKFFFSSLHKIRISPLLPEHYYVLDKNSMLNITKTKEKLKWEPKKDNIDMMKEAYDWVANRQI